MGKLHLQQEQMSLTKERIHLTGKKLGQLITLNRHPSKL
jgi:hypothetical protein